LRARDKSDHEATAMMKAQFMSLWDGKYTSQKLTYKIMKKIYLNGQSLFSNESP
jgi:hypothetical protein